MQYMSIWEMSRDMSFPTMWYVRPAKAQTTLRICAVWSEPQLVDWISYDCQATDWTPFGVSKLNRRLHRLVWVYTCWKSHVTVQMLASSCYRKVSVSLHQKRWKLNCHIYLCYLLNYFDSVFTPKRGVGFHMVESKVQPTLDHWS